ncbi:hypothetical protein [Corallococcus sp. CA053C]|uniref:hypothetical protein n=1 Tax=Corallococcus sp. CA053C TaxID=2316732 RepID=UPI001315AAC2|nr:hypothetical protein [Corallococcus sp. CA053C]
MTRAFWPRFWLVALAAAATACGLPGSQDREVLTSDESLYAVLEVVPRSGVPLENDRVGPTRVIAVGPRPCPDARSAALRGE